MTVTVQQAMRRQQRACAELGFPFYTTILEGCLADFAAGGPVADVFEGHGQVRSGDLLPLRFLGGVHRLVLERKAPALALHYGSVGGDGDAHSAWPAFRRTVEEHVDTLRTALDRPPQTNDVGRSPLLAGALAGILTAAPMPIRLFELGASAGLNLLVDRFRFEGEQGSWGSRDADLVLTGASVGSSGWPSAPLRVIEREGCDLHPIDPTTTSGRLTLTSFVWPDDQVRHARLSAAVKAAQHTAAPVVERDALDYVRGLHPVAGALTVIWHSVALMYVPRDHREAVGAAIAALGARATEQAPVVEIGFEPEDLESTRFPIRVRSWPQGTDVIVASASAHGAEVDWWV
jgi:hypothetical protein